jgi:hypothetical protein
MSDKQTQISPELQTQLGKLNLRLNDYIEQMNIILKAFVDEIQKKDAEIQKLKTNSEASSKS